MNPDSLLIRTRRSFSRWLNPQPERGEAWCIGCSQNENRTLILPAADIYNHVRSHHDMGSLVNIAIRE